MTRLPDRDEIQDMLRHLIRDALDSATITYQLPDEAELREGEMWARASWEDYYWDKKHTQEHTITLDLLGAGWSGTATLNVELNDLELALPPGQKEDA